MRCMHAGKATSNWNTDERRMRERERQHSSLEKVFKKKRLWKRMQPYMESISITQNSVVTSYLKMFILKKKRNQHRKHWMPLQIDEIKMKPNFLRALCLPFFASVVRILSFFESVIIYLFLTNSMEMNCLIIFYTYTYKLHRAGRRCNDANSESYGFI